MIKNLPAKAGDTRDANSIPGQVDSLEKEIGIHLPGFLPGKFHGQRSLEGYSPWNRKKLDMTE